MKKCGHLEKGRIFVEPDGASASKVDLIKRLSRLGATDKTGGSWRIGDPLLAAWIRARPESEF